MHKKSENTEIDIPKDDVECWEKYPKHRWVYDLSRLLDAQNIKWSPYETDELLDKIVNIKLMADKTVLHQVGYIYTKTPTGNHLISEICILKGEIKDIRHISPVTEQELDSLVGQLELRLNAFITLYFQKFTGVISVETHGSDIYKIQLRPHSDLGLITNPAIVKLIKRIYKKTDLTIVGLKDRVLHETLAS